MRTYRHRGAKIADDEIGSYVGEKLLFLVDVTAEDMFIEELATLGEHPVFALPGNPRAVLVAWYEYVLPYLMAMQGASQPWLPSAKLPIGHGVELTGWWRWPRRGSMRGS